MYHLPVTHSLLSSFFVLYLCIDNLHVTCHALAVETVGDCYVAVCGLPDPKKDHAVIMARFARDILRKMRPLCKKLELTLGPDTGDLNIRIGLHSGPVTGGVLKGERRLQLFGDTVNVAARMEQTGQGGQIHVSHHTRELLVKAGKSSWLTVRPTRVLAKGKGQMDTYWLAMRSDTTSSVSDSFGGSEQDDDDDDDEYSDVEESNRDTSATPMDASTSAHLQVVSCHRITSAKVERLVKWNCDILRRLLKQIVARRQYLVEANPGRKADADEHESLYLTKTHGSLVNEVKESITLPAFNFSKEAAEQAESMELDPKVDEQLVSFVRSVAKMYTDNPFHNFEHAR